MLWVVNAFAFAFAATFWAKHGMGNILATMALAGLAVVNAALASPTVVALLAP